MFKERVREKVRKNGRERERERESWREKERARKFVTNQTYIFSPFCFITQMLSFYLSLVNCERSLGAHKWQLQAPARVSAAYARKNRKL